MKGARWFLWDVYTKVTLATIAAVSALSLAVSQVAHIEYLASYYYMLPMVIVIFMTVFSFSLTTASRNMALSMNCRRTDFFWESHIAFAVTDAVSILIVWLAGILPKLLGWGYDAVPVGGRLFNGVPLFAEPAVCLFLLAVCLFLQPIGAAAGCLYEKSKAWATVFLLVIMLLGMAGTVILLFIGDGTIPEKITRIIGGVTLAVLGVTFAVCEVYFYRSNARAVVR